MLQKLNKLKKRNHYGFAFLLPKTDKSIVIIMSRKSEGSGEYELSVTTLYVILHEMSTFKNLMRKTAVIADTEAEKILAIKNFFREKLLSAMAAICICTHIPPNDIKNAATGKMYSCIVGSVTILLISKRERNRI